MPKPSRDLYDRLKLYYIPVFYAAFHPYHLTIFIVVVSGIWGYRQSTDAAIGAATLGLMLVAPIAWGAAVIFVDRNYREILDAFNTEASRVARDIFGVTGEPTASHQISRGVGSVTFVRPNQYYKPVTILVGETSLLVYNDAMLSFDILNPEFGSGTREFYFDSIASVNYDSPYFEIKLIDGDRERYKSSRKPDSVLHELQQRVREYKAKAAA